MKKKPRKKTAVAIRRANSLKGWRTRRKMRQARKLADSIPETVSTTQLPEPDFSGASVPEKTTHNP